jgi:hypothetical protein
MAAEGGPRDGDPAAASDVQAPGQEEPEPRQPASFTAPVIDGVQIYECTTRADGSTAFTQVNVRATLSDGIQHSFVTPKSGPPQWIAPDGSAVTGAVAARTPDGTGNIPLLELNATQKGAPTGLLAGVTRISRLATRGGVAPAGPCDVGVTAEVPYGADYVFTR